MENQGIELEKETKKTAVWFIVSIILLGCSIVLPFGLWVISLLLPPIAEAIYFSLPNGFSLFYPLPFILIILSFIFFIISYSTYKNKNNKLSLLTKIFLVISILILGYLAISAVTSYLSATKAAEDYMEFLQKNSDRYQFLQ